ncbi:sensor histidine kinase [Oharaeibacter diazotrophicus]|uniref:Histidine kinase n=2 Tax=Oharaeibacter diazotrophicus TaxID=1920512 RepID=A0A4R6RC97_9HYPH|nr:histidine kinase [Oharaeibacter diazotrophicus]TDP83296.1 histidine kinase [Oharaeibacter diazotrophicus]BBE72129.1 sensor histidine kinase YehU [Pleomorphomonas sp. SM30]GLS78895.1 hypothetical protein GCM10007904_42320 [Oharaeibacter diazotrophicus]
MEIDGPGDSSREFRRAALGLGLVYWAGVFVSSSFLWGLAGTDPITSAPGKLAYMALCSGVTTVIALVLMRVTTLSFPAKAALCFVLAHLAGPVGVAINFGIYVVCVWPQPVVFDLHAAALDMVDTTAGFFGWACLFMALLYSFEVRDRERRLAAVREEALAAQMRALRYQVNPHFLFNTLNSIAGLVEEGAAERAGRMVMSLSTFLRTTLAVDPFDDVPLADEIALQAGYLAIERERFSDRLRLGVDAPPDLMDALVPSLILQPLVENAVKHGVGATAGSVEIALAARRSAGRLQLIVENDMPAAPCDAPPGIGLGLRNVADRLAARFPGDAAFSAGPVAPGRWRAVVDLPWRAA